MKDVMMFNDHEPDSCVLNCLLYQIYHVTLDQAGGCSGYFENIDISEFFLEININSSDKLGKYDTCLCLLDQIT